VPTEPSLDRRSKRLLILLVARFGQPVSAWTRRALASAREDLPAAQVRAIRSGELDSPAFSPSERALLALARRFLEAPRVESSFYDAAERYYTTRQLFEAVLTLGVYQSLACLPGDAGAAGISPALQH